MQGFNLTTKILNNIVELCKQIETPEDIFNDKGDGSQHSKNSNQYSAIHHKAPPANRKGSNKTSKPLEEDKKNKKIINPVSCTALDTI